ncbi:MULTISPECIES: branched-chain amino acid ABC transporter permease [unclassified Afifella]|uniref:branched-chain amino acid ABC transporter permease n=1 Tax=unclassified Afifella TaxID=2624128 RepID=UPI001F17973F|nr:MULTISPECIES: branched-chain amino acid ABC transporter permease [unclassified Afifella]MCF1503747.1 branched-chain amino acid ABC transporter permease [Afifella sp. H1R]MCT8267775.1 branched-chain amino acid ABC transporter permease [Afifella sp. JA880]
MTDTTSNVELSDDTFRRHRLAGYLIAAVGIAALAVAPFLGIYPIFLMKLLCFALFACAFNLMLGYVGLLSFGHAAFFGMAAYVAGHAVKVWGIGTVFGIAAGTLTAGVMGLVFGAIAIRQKGIYFAMITLALAQMVFFFCLQAPFTHGEDGIQGIPRGTVFGLIDLRDTLTMYYFVAVIFAAGFFVLYRTVHSPFGQALKGIRENEPRMISLGYPVALLKVLAFTMSATITGLAGATKAIVFQSATLTDVNWHMSGEVVLMTLIGGMGTILGPVVGAGIVIALQNYLSTIGSWVTVVMGAIFVICVLTFRRGIVGEILAWMRR